MIENDSYHIVTLLGQWPLSHSWVPACMQSWSNLQGASREINVISDGSLESLISFPPYTDELDLPIQYSPDNILKVDNALKNYPALATIRSLDLTWRKLLDPVILFPHYQRILLIDTDVIVRKPVIIPNESGIFYLREDIPAYQGSPMIPWKFPTVKSFNAGFILFEPSTIDLDFLERVVSKYFLGLKNFWWSEQLAWSLCAGRLPKRFIWKGKHCVVLSGFDTRNLLEISTNVVKLFSSKKVLNAQEISYVAGDAIILHLAGKGKHHWAEFPVSFNSDPVELEYELDPLTSLFWKMAISLRLISKNLTARG